MTDTNFLVIDNLTNDQIKRLFSKIEPDFETGCWNWTGYCDRSGYGRWEYTRKDNLVYRILYAWFVQPAPKGRAKDIPVLDHLCKNRQCCNPSHLELVSDEINLLRSNTPSIVNRYKTHCKNGHPLPAPIYSVPWNKWMRTCKICKRDYDIEYRARLRDLG